MIRCGLLGEKLGHSYSPQIHSELGEYEYKLFETDISDIEGFIRNGHWDGLNVTIPYKKSVIPYITELSTTSMRTGSVNTLIRRPDGSIFGDNTDVYGFIRLTEHSGMTVSGRKVLVLGSGGASAAAVAALEEMHAFPVVISRSGDDNYLNLDRHRDAKVIVNATPVGMYPGNGASPVDLSLFLELEGVLDLIYNPARTALLMQAEMLGIPYENGLYMLVAQAKRSSEMFTGLPVPDSKTDRIYDILRISMMNIILTGAPRAIMNETARSLGMITGRKVTDVREEIIKHAGGTPEAIISQYGYTEYRNTVRTFLADIGKLSGTIVTAESSLFDDEEDLRLLRQNGTVVMLVDDRGLPYTDDIFPMQRHADITVRTSDNYCETAERIAKAIK